MITVHSGGDADRMETALGSVGISIPNADLTLGRDQADVDDVVLIDFDAILENDEVFDLHSYDLAVVGFYDENTDTDLVATSSVSYALAPDIGQVPRRANAPDFTNTQPDVEEGILNLNTEVTREEDEWLTAGRVVFKNTIEDDTNGPGAGGTVASDRIHRHGLAGRWRFDEDDELVLPVEFEVLGDIAPQFEATIVIEGAIEDVADVTYGTR